MVQLLQPAHCCRNIKADLAGACDLQIRQQKREHTAGLVGDARVAAVVNVQGCSKRILEHCWSHIKRLLCIWCFLRIQHYSQQRITVGQASLAFMGSPCIRMQPCMQEHGDSACLSASVLLLLLHQGCTGQALQWQMQVLLMLNVAKAASFAKLRGC
jgi:hypothetical protein